MRPTVKHLPGIWVENCQLIRRLGGPLLLWGHL